MRLDKELSWKASRSRWIAKAITAKFESMDAFNMGDLSNMAILMAFHGRICGCMNHDTCIKIPMLKSMLPIEEIVE